jgi:putative PIN family toxin of toxin-antitoxin system
VIRAVLDTNVLASGLAGEGVPASIPGAVLRHWRAGDFDLITAPSILAELSRTLTKSYFRSRRSDAQIEAAIQLIVAEGSFVVPTVEVFDIASHPEDDLVLAAAVSAQVDYLVTGDRMLLRLSNYHGVSILSPRAFLDLLDAEG